MLTGPTNNPLCPTGTAKLPLKVIGVKTNCEKLLFDVESPLTSNEPDTDWETVNSFEPVVA